MVHRVLLDYRENPGEQVGPAMQPLAQATYIWSSENVEAAAFDWSGFASMWDQKATHDLLLGFSR